MKKLFRFRTSRKESSLEEANSSNEDSRRLARRQTISETANFIDGRNGFGEKDTQIERERVKVGRETKGIATVLQDDKTRDNVWDQAEDNVRLGNVPKQHEGEQIAAGWPAWLTAAAGEALKGWLPRRADSFEKIDKIGQGTYSNVYKARDLESGKVVALKKVRFDNLEPESVRFMAREIKILRRLDHPNVVKLEGLVTSRMSCSLYLVFEYMDHDLAEIVSSPGITFTESQVKCCLLQILRGLEHCHSRRVLHRDIKGSNLLLNSEGNVKIADFGLATFYQPDRKQQLTTRVVTLWYRPPELLLGATEYGVAVDLWSTGCILGELFARRPIMPGRTEVEQLHKIFRLCGSPSEEYWEKHKLPNATIFRPQHPYKRCLSETYKDFPQTALDLLEVLLATEPEERGSASSALKSDFFTTKPFACDPSNLPKYSPNKEIDAKIRDGKARRQKAATRKAHGLDEIKRDESQEKLITAGTVQDASGERTLSFEKRHSNIQSAFRTRSEIFNSKKVQPVPRLPENAKRYGEGGGNRTNAFSLDPTVPDAQADQNGVGPRDNIQREETSYMLRSRSARSGRYSSGSDFKLLGNYGTQQTADLSKLSTLVAARNNSSQDLRKDSSDVRQQERVRGGLKSGQYEQVQSFEGLNQNQLTKTTSDFEGQNNRRIGNMGLGAPAPIMHFSGPLLPPSANIDDILDEHERQVQKAVRQARRDKGKNQHRVFVSKIQSNKAKALDDNPESFEIRHNHSSSANLNLLKTAKSHYQGEITEIKNPEAGVESVLENFDRKYDPAYLTRILGN